MDTEAALAWIDGQLPGMVRLLEGWSAINSYTWNLAGLARMAKALEEEFGVMEHIARPAAKRNHVALLFEPAMPDGALVDSRKGSGNFVLVVRGRAAHAGRDFHAGRSAVVALAKIIVRLSGAFADLPDVTINCGKIEGG